VKKNPRAANWATKKKQKGGSVKGGGVKHCNDMKGGGEKKQGSRTQLASEGKKKRNTLGKDKKRRHVKGAEKRAWQKGKTHALKTRHLRGHGPAQSVV